METTTMPPPFSEAVMQHFLQPCYLGTLKSPDGEGRAEDPPSGRFIRIQVRLDGPVLAEARFSCPNCVPLIAAGSWLLDRAVGRPVVEAAAFDPRALEAALGGLPEGRRDCADLAVEALRAALQAARERRAS